MEDISELYDSLVEMGEIAERNLRSAIQASVLKVERTAKEDMSLGSPSAPGEPPAVVTSLLKNSISHRIEEDEEGRPSGVVGTSVEYAWHLEFGTSKMKPRPFLVRAVRVNRDWIVKRFQTALKNAVKKQEGA